MIFQKLVSKSHSYIPVFDTGHLISRYPGKCIRTATRISLVSTVPCTNVYVRMRYERRPNFCVYVAIMCARTRYGFTSLLLYHVLLLRFVYGGGNVLTLLIDPFPGVYVAIDINSFMGQ